MAGLAAGPCWLMTAAQWPPLRNRTHIGYHLPRIPAFTSCNPTSNLGTHINMTQQQQQMKLTNSTHPT